MRDILQNYPNDVSCEFDDFKVDTILIFARCVLHLSPVSFINQNFI